MKNKLPILIISSILILLVLGIAIYLQVKKSNINLKVQPNNQNLKEQKITREKDVKEETIFGSLQDILKLNKSIKCTFNYSEMGEQAEGTTYVSGNKTRVELDFKQNNQTTATIIISDGEYFYSWSSTLPNQGFKMKIKKESKNYDTDQTVESIEAFKNIDQKYDYKCLPWIADNSVFIVPSNIKFTDFSETLQDLKTKMPVSCESCDSLDEETAKQQCKIQLNCD